MITMRGSVPPRMRMRWLIAATSWADEIRPVVRDEMRRQAPIGKGPRAGRLRSSIRTVRHSTPAMVRVEVTANTPYAEYVIKGTGPHTITATAARTLHWNDGSDRFARSVRNPGSKANPFPTRAMGKLTPVLDEAFARNMRGGI